MRADIVIGANFGDEGKGLITDFYASRHKKCLVIRHNSGAQAGHTVTTADGKRHVFGHIGSGSFAGASTYLSRFYVCNPFLFRKEYNTLAQLITVPSIYVDRRTLISTPYDIIINQMIEEARGDRRHGSCGVGFGETIERSQYPAYTVTLADLDNIELFLKKLLAIRGEWLPRRLLSLGIAKIPETWIDRIDSRHLLEDYIDATGFFMRTIKPVTGVPMLQHDHIVCEGAQGLLLDQDHDYFPHVTRSHTGIRNAMTVLGEAGITDARITYITRSYMTRHGAGPLPHELVKQPYRNIIDATNINNDYQGHLRFAWPDIDRIAQAIRHDLQFVSPANRTSFGLAVTCIDQIDHLIGFVQGGQLYKTTPEEFLDRLYTVTGAEFGLESWGPTRSDVRISNFLDVTAHRA
jgi:adenylosuccinate synthase